MADNTNVHPQQNPFFPFALPTMPALPGMPTFGLDLWKQAAEAWFGRVAAMTEESAKVEALGAERARAAIDESARLMRESLTYSLSLSAEWRKLAMEGTRQMLSMATQGVPLAPTGTPKAG